MSKTDLRQTSKAVCPSGHTNGWMDGWLQWAKDSLHKHVCASYFLNLTFNNKELIFVAGSSVAICSQTSCQIYTDGLLHRWMEKLSDRKHLKCFQTEAPPGEMQNIPNDKTFSDRINCLRKQIGNVPLLSTSIQHLKTIIKYVYIADGWSAVCTKLCRMKKIHLPLYVSEVLCVKTVLRRVNLINLNAEYIIASKDVCMLDLLFGG